MNPMMAARAYAAVQGGAMPTGGAPAPAAGDNGFADLVQSAMTDMSQQTRAAETQMTSAVNGHGSLIDVVTALSSAETQLETVVSIRDQVISAYKEIMAMPI